MASSSAEILIHLLQTNHQVLHEQVDGLTQEESLRQLPFEGNCLNWVIGHILYTLYEGQEWLGVPSKEQEFFTRTYGNGSEPMTDPAKACRLDDMLKRVDAAVALIISQLECTPPAELEIPVQLWMGPISRLEALFFMLWHASYHTGQLEPLRQLDLSKR